MAAQVPSSVPGASENVLIEISRSASFFSSLICFHNKDTLSSGQFKFIISKKCEFFCKIQEESSSLSRRKEKKFPAGRNQARTGRNGSERNITRGNHNTDCPLRQAPECKSCFSTESFREESENVPAELLPTGFSGKGEENHAQEPRLENEPFSPQTPTFRTSSRSIVSAFGMAGNEEACF